MVKKVLPFGAQKFSLDGKGGQEIKKRLTVKVKLALGVAMLLSTLTIVVLLVCIFAVDTKRDYWLPSNKSPSKLGVYSKTAVSTDAAICAPIGREILEKNGSAVDSAIAMLLCMGVTNPQSQGLGGGFLMTVYDREKEKAFFLDAREMAPLKAYEDMFHGNANLTKFGGLAIAVPGELAGYAYAHERFGKLPWKELFLPAINLCRTGIPVPIHLAKNLRIFAKEIKEHEAFRKWFVNNETGEVLKEGDIMYRPDMASTLSVIANDGKAALYDPDHPLGAKFLEDLKDMGSIIEKADLLEYKPTFSDPVSIKLRNNMTVYSSGIPGSGSLLAFMLNILDGYNITSNLAKNKDDAILLLHRILEAFKFAYAKRMYLEDDPTTVKALVENLASKEYAESVRSMINDSRTFDDPAYYGVGDAMAKDDHGTSHVSVVAPNGDAVSVTSTINIYFGSFEMSQSTGIILNNEMDDFSIPNVVSYFGVPPSVHNMIKPKKRPMSSMCPTLIVDNEKNIRLVVGGNGGTKITTSILQVILRNIWLDEDVKFAIDAQRFHNQLLPDVVTYDHNFPPELLEGLRAKGHKVAELTDGMQGIVMAVAKGEDGFLYANSDYRKGGGVDGF